MDKKTIGKIALIVAGIYGGFISRWHGGGFFKAPKWLKSFLWSVPFGIGTGFCFSFEFGPYIYIPVGIVVAAAAWAGKVMGKGGGQDLAHSPEEPGAGRDLEGIEHIIFWLYPHLPRYWYDALLLTVNGFLAALIPSLAMGYLDIISGLICFIGGFGVVLGYSIGWSIYPNFRGNGPKNFNEATQIGEAFGGLFSYVFLAGSVFNYLLIIYK